MSLNVIPEFVVRARTVPTLKLLTVEEMIEKERSFAEEKIAKGVEVYEAKLLFLMGAFLRMLCNKRINRLFIYEETVNGTWEKYAFEAFQAMLQEKNYKWEMVHGEREDPDYSPAPYHILVFNLE